MSGTERERSKGRIATCILDRRVRVRDAKGATRYGRVASLFLRWVTLDDHAAEEQLFAHVETVTGELIEVRAGGPDLLLEPSSWADEDKPPVRRALGGDSHPLLDGIE